MRAKALLGWLTREVAVPYLQNDCIFDPPLTTKQAEDMWAEKKAIVDALDPRPVLSPARLEMTVQERETADRFLAFHRKKSNGRNRVEDVIKIDPGGLVIRQLDLNVDQAKEHDQNVHAKTWSARHCLPTERPQAPLNRTTLPNGWNFALPHSEFMMEFNGSGFAIAQTAPHVTVSTVETRTVLWAGYHRCYARLASVGAENMDRSVLAAVTNDGNLTLGPESADRALRDLVLGEKPPMLADFLNERLFVEVEVHRKRFELRIRVAVARLNID